MTSMMSALDVLPTLAEWTGAALPVGRVLDGQSVSDVLLQKGPPELLRHPPHREIYYYNNGVCEAVRVGDWKYREVRAVGGGGIVGGAGQGAAKELFNLAWDPSERTNVIAEYREKAKELEGLMGKFPGSKEN